MIILCLLHTVYAQYYCFASGVFLIFVPMRKSLAPSSSSKKFKAGNSGDACDVPPLLQNYTRSTSDILDLINSSDDHTDHVRSVDSDRECDSNPPLGESDLSENKSPMRSSTNKVCFEVLWCKRSSRKHKKWEGDGVLEVFGRAMTLKSLEGETLGQVSGCKAADIENLTDGSVLAVGSREVEIQRQLSERECNLLLHSDAEHDSTTRQSSNLAIPQHPSTPDCRSVSAVRKTFVSPLVGAAVSATNRNGLTAARFDPAAPDALVLPRPSHQFQAR